MRLLACAEAFRVRERKVADLAALDTTRILFSPHLNPSGEPAQALAHGGSAVSA